MSTVKSSSANLTLNADGSGNDIKFQSNAVEVGSLTDAGLLTATSFAGSSTFTANSSSSGDYVRMYGSSGTGKWDIYGNGANLRFSDNDSAGSIVFDRQINASGGVAIGGTGAANTLDDYEEGTFTAALTPASGSITMSAATMSYTKIGRLVYIGGYISISGESSASGSLKLTGLPFTCRNSNDAKCSMSFWANGLASNEIIEWVGEVIPNQTYCYFYRGAAGTITDDCTGDVDSAFDMRFMFTYTTDS